MTYSSIEYAMKYRLITIGFQALFGIRLQSTTYNGSFPRMSVLSRILCQALFLELVCNQRLTRGLIFDNLAVFHCFL